jgi:hypothetical protein
MYSPALNTAIMATVTNTRCRMSEYSVTKRSSGAQRVTSHARSVSVTDTWGPGNPAGGGDSGESSPQAAAAVHTLGRATVWLCSCEP